MAGIHSSPLCSDATYMDSPHFRAGPEVRGGGAPPQGSDRWGALLVAGHGGVIHILTNDHIAE